MTVGGVTFDETQKLEFFESVGNALLSDYSATRVVSRARLCRSNIFLRLQKIPALWRRGDKIDSNGNIGHFGLGDNSGFAHIPRLSQASTLDTRYFCELRDRSSERKSLGERRRPPMVG